MINKLFVCILVFCTLISLTSAIELYDMEVITNDTWYFGENNNIIVLTKNINSNFSDVSIISINLIENINYTSTPVMRYDVGYYSKGFILNETNLTQVNFNITVWEEEKYITKNIIVNVKSHPWYVQYYNNIEEWVKEKVESFFDNFGDYALGIIIFVFVGLTIAVAFDIITRRKR